MTRAEIVTARAGNPSWYGVRVEAGVTLTKTTASGSIEVASYDDCPNQLDDEPGILLFSSTLSDEYTKITMRTDTFLHSWGFKGSRFFKQEVPSAALLIDAKEQTIHYEKTKYKIRVASSIPKPHKVTWFEEFTPEDSNPEDEVQPEKTLVVKTTTITGAESPVYMIDPAQTPDQEGSWRVFLLPFELNSDLNNDGKVGDAADSSLKATAQQSGASDEAKQKGTEYVFVNDHLSNGLWDKEDLDSTRPASENKDDDAKELKTVCLATWGSIWFEHPIISKLAFYKTKECNAADKLTFPFALSETNRFPEKLYVRAEEVTVQIEGELVMKFGKADKTETWAEDRLKFTIVKEVGDTKYFHAVRDYILENNTLLFTHRKGYPADEPETEFWICAMREEATKMEAVESFHRGAVKLYGIYDVASSYSDLTVVTNGNQVFFSDGWRPSIWEPFEENHRMSDRCHGRLVYAGVSSPATSDKIDKTTVPFGSELADVDANYISQGTTGPFTLKLGRVPSGS